MADPNRKNDIINAARVVFAEQGFHKATIKRIAKEANLKSPALIYWYFDNKEELLKAVITHESSLPEMTLNPQALMGQPPEVVLPMIARQHAAMIQNEYSDQIVRILFAELFRNPQLVESFTMLINGAFSMLQAYFDDQIRIGRFRPHDTTVSTRSFFSINIIYAINVVIFPNIGGGPPPHEAYLASALEIFLRGLEAHNDSETD